MRMKEKLKNLPPILFLRRMRFEKHFATHENVNYFRGVFKNFKAAADSTPLTKPIGYDNAEAANMYKERLKQIYSTDYPVLFWMERHHQEIKRVFDFGGHVGIHYYTYSKYLPLQAIAEWTVCDVSSVVETGKKLSVEKKISNLSFSTDISDCEKYDLFLANGSLQYLEWELHEKLKLLNDRPKFVLVNTTPIHPENKTITLQSIGTSFCPYHVRKESEFLKGMESIGYELVDLWKNEEKKCHIAFEKERSLDYYRGAFFIRKS
jgi:putative methyltransferase (TIGR04325 family)